MPAEDSMRIGGLPLGLAHKVRLINAVPAGRHVRWDDVEIDEDQSAVAFRRLMERATTGLQREALIASA
jgi:predicted homoserine dehydrogenase-like protein